MLWFVVPAPNLTTRIANYPKCKSTNFGPPKDGITVDPFYDWFPLKLFNKCLLLRPIFTKQKSVWLIYGDDKKTVFKVEEYLMSSKRICEKVGFFVELPKNVYQEIAQFCLDYQISKIDFAVSAFRSELEQYAKEIATKNNQ